MDNLKEFTIKNKKMIFPVYFPDATRGVIRSLDSQDIRQAKIEGVIVNTYHLLSQPGTTVIKEFGGIKNYMDWDGWAISDSGGFQLLSLVYKNKGFGKISKDGIIFYRGSRGQKKKHYFTPEKSIQTQFTLNTDIIICLDDCPAVNAKEKEIDISVERTILWAKRCKEEFQKQIEIRKLSEVNRPLLLAVIQGGNDKQKRKYCAQKLIEIGFDAYGFGGWPMDEAGNFNHEIVGYTASLMPPELPKFALGVGNPKAIIEGFKSGYNIFDCVLPTRDARHRRLYCFAKDPDKIDILNDKNIFEYLYINREKYVRDQSPISNYCDCHACRNYSRGYLSHLFEIEESLAWRLATIHNLRTYSKLIELLRNTLSRGQQT